MNQKYDPKLREIAEEFKSLCKNYDVGAVVLFVSPSHAEFVNYISPSWSVAKIEGPGLRFRSKREDFKSKEEQDHATESTTHMLTSIVEWSRQINGDMRQVLEQLGKHMRIGWKTWGDPDSVPGDGK